MARIEYDEDEHDGDRAGASGGDWRRRLVTWALALAGLGIGFLVPYTLYLNHQISERFGELRWQVPTRVYARPLRLAPGLAMDAQTLKTELDAAAYREGDGVRAGTYLREDGRWTIASRGFRDVDGAVERVLLARLAERLLRILDLRLERLEVGIVILCITIAASRLELHLPTAGAKDGE